LSGFIGKLALVRATLDAEAWVTTAVILAVSLLTILSMARLWEESFWKAADQPDKSDMKGVMLAPIAGLVVVTLGLTVAAGPLFTLTLRVSEQLLNRDAYIRAVLQGGGQI